MKMQYFLNNRAFRNRLLLSLLVLCIFTCIPWQASAASTEIRVVKYAVDEYTILAEKTVDYLWMEQNLMVYGDGITHYYLQGPVFVDDQDTVEEEELRWNVEEDTNVQEKDMGAVKGTALRDLCELVGGMEAKDRIIIHATDGFRKEFAYQNIYEPPSRQGEMVVTWWREGEGYVPSYKDGMRLVFFADTSTNPWGLHAMGNWDWHESADEGYWYFYYNGEEQYPTTTGLSIQKISEISIYSQEEPRGSINITSTPPGADIYLDGEETGEVTPFILVDLAAGSHTVSVQKEGYLSSSEEWVEVSHKIIIPVYFELEREYSSPVSGSSDSYFSQDTLDVGEQGSLEVAARGIRGNLSIQLATGKSQVCRSGQTLSYRIATGTPSHYPSSWARLYVFSHGGYTSDQDLEIRINDVKAGEPERSTYLHSDGKISETLAFNISPLVQTSVPIEVSVRNPPGGNEWTIYPPILLASHEGGEDQTRENWIAEGTTFVHAVKEYSPQDLQNITISDFSDIQGGFSHAELLVIGTATEDPDISSPMVFQNSAMIPGEYTYDQDSIWISRFNATATLSEYTHNELFWKASDPKDARVVGAMLAILTVDYPREPVNAEGGMDTTSVVETVRPPSTFHSNNLTFPTIPVLTSATPNVPGIELIPAIQDESFLSRIWRMIFWIFGIPLPDYGTKISANRGDSPQEILDQKGSGENNTFSTESISPSFVTYPLNVSTTPPGAILTLSGLTEMSTAPATFVLPEGDYLVDAEREGYLGCQTMVHLTGPHEIIMILLPDDTVQQNGPEKTAARSRHGGLLIITYPGGLEVSVDNNKMESKSPLVLYGLKEGSHIVKAIRPSATAGKGVTVNTRVWVYHDALSLCELDFVGIRLDRRIRITDPTGNSTAFTLNGLYPLLRTPITLEIPGTRSFITLFGEGTYTSIPIQDSLMDGNGFSLPSHGSEYHTIAIESSPPGAEIFIDGLRTGIMTPSLVRGLSEGPHRVMVSLSGYVPAQRVISIPRTQEEFIEGNLSFIMETYPCGPLRVESVPDGASVYLDGVATGEKTPADFTGISLGIHELTLRSGEITRTRDITIRPGNPNRYFVELH